MLGYADYSKSYILEPDASNLGLGAMLSQKQDGEERVIAFASHHLCPPEQNMSSYSSMKLEFLAMEWAVTEKFRDYLLGSKFDILTANNHLSHLQTAKLGAVEQRWVSWLALFNFKIHPGKSNRRADALSRQRSEPKPDAPVTGEGGLHSSSESDTSKVDHTTLGPEKHHLEMEHFSAD